MRNASRYVKTFSALLGAISTWGVTAYADNSVTPVEMFGLLAVLGTVAAVFQFPNDTGADPNTGEQAG